MDQSIISFNPNHGPFDQIVQPKSFDLIVHHCFLLAILETQASVKQAEVLSHDVETISTLTQVLTVMQLSVMYLFKIQILVFSLLIKSEIRLTLN